MENHSSVESPGKKTILFIIGGLGIGGKERQLVELIHGLPQERYRCHLLVKKHDAYYLSKISGQLSSFCSLDRDSFRLFDFVTIARHITRIKPDVVCSWVNIASHFSLLAKCFTRHPYQLINCCIRNAPVRLPPALKFERLMYSVYGTVVANSKAGLAAYGQEGRKGRYVLYNGFDLGRVPACNRSEARKKLGLDDKQFLVVMVASLSKLKDHKTLLKAAVICKEQSEKIHFLLVGDGTEREGLEVWCQKNKLGSTVSFLGRRNDVELFFKASDISVLSSTAWFGEGISNSILESMACGTPVIASDSPGTREVIEDGKNGFLFPGGDHRDLAGKILHLETDTGIRECFIQSSKVTIRQKFSISSMIDSFDSIVASCDRS